MIASTIYSYLKTNLPDLTTGGRTNIYPQVVPDGIDFEKAITYNLLNFTRNLNVTSASIQLTVVSRGYAEHQDFVEDIVRLVDNKIYSQAGDPLSVNVESVVELDRDEENNYYLTAITLELKTQRYASA